MISSAGKSGYIYSDVRSGHYKGTVQDSCKGGSAGLGLTASQAATRLFLGVTLLLHGYCSSLSVSRLQSADRLLT